MTTSLPLLIHIGHAKAGSTWLQAHLFDNPALGFQTPFERRSVRAQFVNKPPFQFDAESCRKYFDPVIQSIDPTHAFPVMSCEGLTGTSRIGGHQQKTIADRLAKVFPEAKIVFVIREQKSMLLAQYHQYLRRGGAWSLRSFLNPPTNDGHRIPYFEWDRFQYHYLLEYYQQLFGQENVLALPLELLGEGPESFVTQVADLCGLSLDSSQISALPVSTRQRTSQSSFVMNLRRPLNLLIGERTSFNPSPLMPIQGTKKLFNRWSQLLDSIVPQAVKHRYQTRIEAMLSATVADYFAMSNRRLCELTGHDLEKLGYEVASTRTDNTEQPDPPSPENIQRTHRAVAA